MKEYSIQHISEIVSGKLIYKTETVITHLLIDSRLLSLPEESVFFAIKNIRDGHKYIESLYHKGVRNFVVSNYNEKLKKLDANFILVEDTTQALQSLASAHRQNYKIPVFGITGSNGKTITKEWLFQAFEIDHNVVRNPRSYNSQFGVPLSVWNIEEKHDIAFFEAGLSKPNEMQKLEQIIKPTIGIFTYLGDAHQSNFDTLEQKLDEKIKLFKDSETIIYNKDEELVDEKLRNIYPTKRFFTWSYMADSDIRIEKINKLNKHSVLRYSYKGQKFDLQIPFDDNASICNIMSVLCTLVWKRFKFETIQERIVNLQPVSMRMEIKEGQNNCLIVNDSYNSDINSLGIALGFTNNQAHHEKKTLIISDIYQSDYTEHELYNKVAQLLKQYSFDKIIGVGTEITRNKQEFSDFENYFFNSTEALISYIQRNKFIKNETILLKGSRVFKFEKISTLLEQRVHQTVMEINMNAMTKNLNYYKSKLKASTEMIIMVKAFSYGTGSHEVANLLQTQGADYLAVAFADEGSELRDHGISMPIIVMNPEPHSFHSIIENNLEPEIYNFRILDSFISFLKENAIKLYPIHLKFDSGMHRSGFCYADVEKLSAIFLQNNEVYISSVFSHLAGSDSDEFDNFTKQQVMRFEKSYKLLEEKTEFVFKKHILNSAGIERFNQYQMDMVRLGIGLYGVGVEENKNKIENVVTLKTLINQVQTVEKSETVGYDRKGKLNRDSIIAVLPIGYADGLDRKLGNGNYKMLINGHWAPTIGNICMDMCMIDITDVPEVKEGDEVIIFGDQNPISEMAKVLETIPYEISTNISRRVKRIYYS